MSKADKIDFSNTEIAFKRLSDKQLRLNYFIFGSMNYNWLVKIGTFLIKLALKTGLPVKFLIKSTIFQLFCGGEDIQECSATINSLSKYGVGTILDYSVEGEDSEASFDKTRDEILKTIQEAKNNPDKIPFSVFKVTGVASRRLLTEVQENGIEKLSEEKKKSYNKLVGRIEELCKSAANNNVRLFVDAEDTYIQDVIDELVFKEMKKYNKPGEKVIIYNTYQLYRTEAYNILKKHFEQAKSEGFGIGAKLVRGAYMEKERERAVQIGYADPINPDKPSTDREYDMAVELCVNNIDYISVCLGTHNNQSSLLAAKIMDEKNISKNDKRIFFAQLLGMSDNISFNLANAGYNVAKYVPYGPVESVMPYLFRRADENTSIAGQTNREYLFLKKELEHRKKA